MEDEWPKSDLNFVRCFSLSRVPAANRVRFFFDADVDVDVDVDVEKFDL